MFVHMLSTQRNMRAGAIDMKLGVLQGHQSPEDVRLD